MATLLDYSGKTVCVKFQIEQDVLKDEELRNKTLKNYKSFNYKPSNTFYKILSKPDSSYYVEIESIKQTSNQIIKTLIIYIYASNTGPFELKEYMKNTNFKIIIDYVYTVFNDDSISNLTEEKQLKNNFFQNKFKSSSDILNQLKQTKITETNMQNINVIIHFYLEKLGKNKSTINITDKLLQFYKKFQEVHTSLDHNSSVKTIEEYVKELVKNTIYLSNHFKNVNNLLFFRIFSQIFNDEEDIYYQFTNYSIKDLFSKYHNIDATKINMVKDNLIENITEELLNYINKYIELKFNHDISKHEQIVYRVTEMSQLISFKLFNHIIFYTDDSNIFFFSVNEIIDLISKNLPNPFTNKPFSTIFKDTIKYLFIKNPNKHNFNVAKSSIKDNQNYGNINIILNNLCTDSKFNTKTFLDKFQEVKATFKHPKSIKPLGICLKRF